MISEVSPRIALHGRMILSATDSLENLTIASTALGSVVPNASVAPRFSNKKAYAQTFAATAAIRAFGALSGILAARLLGSVGRGELAVIVFMPMMLVSLGEFEFSRSVVVESSRGGEMRAELVATAFWVACILGFLGQTSPARVGEMVHALFAGVLCIGIFDRHRPGPRAIWAVQFLSGAGGRHLCVGYRFCNLAQPALLASSIRAGDVGGRGLGRTSADGLRSAANLSNAPELESGSASA
jgi:hypothetical protein